MFRYSELIFFQGQGDANVIEHMAGLSSYAGPGGWNDPDFLMIGEWTYIAKDVDYQTEFSFWCLFSAPLIIATDIRNLSNKQQILNADAIAVNQGWNGYAGDRVSKFSDGGEVWCKPLQDYLAVILYNSNIRLGKRAIDVTVQFNTLPVWPQNSTSASIYDIWQHQTIGMFSYNYTVSLTSHESVFLRLYPQ
jgi:alpha-galactosidase